MKERRSEPRSINTTKEYFYHGERRSELRSINTTQEYFYHGERRIDKYDAGVFLSWGVTSVRNKTNNPPQPVMDLRLASYNVHCFPWVPTSIEEIVDLICKNCDVVALQEVWCRQTAWAAIFAERGWTFVAPAREHHIASLLGSGLAIAHSPKWRVTESRFYPFLASGGLDFLAAKGWFRVELVRVVDGFPVRLINTHMQADYEVCQELWHPVTEGIRMAQSLQMIEVERRLPLMPTLIVGDLNTEECLVPGGAFLRKGKGATFPTTGQVLDHCVDVAFGPAGWRLMDHSVLPSPLSDHWPVFWSFLWGME